MGNTSAVSGSPISEQENDLVFISEDNGVGVPEKSKKLIFRREYLRNTGYGLFLIVEISRHSPVFPVSETGAVREAGTGLRFMFQRRAFTGTVSPPAKVTVRGKTAFMAIYR